MLARLHLAAADMPRHVPNPCGAAWRQSTGARLLPLLSRDEQALLSDELRFQSDQDYASLLSRHHPR
jgi:homoserine kinase type II